MPSSRSGFTLIEILCAMGAFILVFLTGSGGLMRLMMTQTTNQQRTVAASAALLLADWHAAKSVAVAPAASNFETNVLDFATHNVTYPTVSSLTSMWPASDTDKKKFWRGPLPHGTENIYTFMTSTALLGAPYAATLDLAAYQQIIFTITTPSTADATGMKFHVVTFWYGDPVSTTTNIADRFEFLGSYLMPDRAP
jgi:type II secretory pathway pseudopilin PulG